MKHPYNDIRTRIAEAAQWHDYNGVPRYSAFTPEDCPDPYAVEVLLLEAACRHCGNRFKVEMHNGPTGGPGRLAREARSGRINCGEPPHHDCPGDVLNSRSVRILEFYTRESGELWKRDPSLEVPLESEAAQTQ